ncbi:MAG: hypothetical protein AABM32_08735 [Chloroflexota bacterium]
MFWRVALVVLASVAIACGQAATLAEPSPTELLQKASANLKNAKTAHIDGTGSFAISSGLSISFDFKMTGDAEMPDKARLTTQMSLLGQSLSVDTVTIGGRTFSKGLAGDDWTETPAGDPQGAILDPLGQTDLSAVVTVTEVDRPEIDGRKTRHLSYAIDQGKLLEKMKDSQSGSTPGLNVATAAGKGEVWIRTDDNQIVRQLVKLSMEMDGDLGIPGASPATGKSTFDISFDLKFTQIGEPISPAITAPPTR